ncbi:hypothetical protein IFM58399_01070 [Aspergillus lentulus]|uniref:Cyclase n=1 Tax=Aspergillus lentulus TaxID=293939 RepID=A0AAN6BL69_ASPLE|nr:uncharacterized protein IFM58399_01070 [Aspergillus lentulus]KAF4152338.1 hypothetical protein CNMCM6069_002236 [Aspergillus lentulus]KAF4162417.1 hypothetical protein CNMCM6936_002105 [Aspergillus lentulus]KAF4172083.1 hypothetical protein CNMCM8060_002007 [Aspergillus lentulus]KAF4177663.1 hypothetical protein CNMCM7927_003013 [Aspergillus lentulus]KAF4191601.1 hypothetical protein CNMCM8694_001665 [Aspergillus lentulus]
MASVTTLPTFDNLTIDPSGPPGNAWGLFGKHNELGMLNLLTPETVRRAASEEIRDGVRFSLDLPLDRIKNPSFGRKPFAQELVNKAPRIVNDDILVFNTQCSTQWDGFRHYGNHTRKCYFNGHSLGDLKTSPVIGIDAWVKHGGIVGRGVLIDYASWATKNSIPLSPFTTTKIPISAIKQIVKENDIRFRPGDILFLRTGFTTAYDKLSPDEELAISQRETPQFAGLEAGEATLRWLWENQFAAVASDSPSFEPSPIAGPQGPPEFQLHQWLLAGWGMPIGEYFDLEGVAEYCAKTNRWSFFLSSVPLKVPGGVASPPNAVAIF